MIRSLGHIRRKEDILNSSGGLQNSLATVNFERLKNHFKEVNFGLYFIFMSI